MAERWPIPGRLLAGILTVATALLCPALAKEPPAGGEKAAITLTMTADMDFGSLADYDGWVDLGPNDVILADPQNIFFGGTPYSAVVTVQGDPDAAVSISITGGSQSGLSLDGFHTDRGDPPLGGVSLGASGRIELRVGGRLTVDSMQAYPGSDRTAPYTITVNYE